MTSPLLVTGMARAGTSFVGRMLMSSGRYVYVNEPLNPVHPPGDSPGILNAKIPQRYFYISSENSERFVKSFSRMLGLQFGFMAEVLQNHRPRDLARATKYRHSFLRGRRQGCVPLVDDPFAVFSAPWLAERFGVQVVMLVRHPCAITASRCRLGHSFDFKHLLDQRLLMRDYLEPFREEMEAMPRVDIVGQSALLWKIIYSTVLRFQEEGVPLIVVRHEDLSRYPRGKFAQLFQRLDLPFDWDTIELIRQATTTEENGHGHTWSRDGGFGKSGYRRLDSRALVDAWRGQLDPDDIEQVRAIVGETADAFYEPEMHWPQPVQQLREN